MTPRDARCINCTHPFTAREVRFSYASAGPQPETVGPLCALCENVIRAHLGPATSYRPHVERPQHA